MIEEDKHSRAIEMRTSRLIHELNDFCKSNVWTRDFEWSAEVDESGPTNGFVMIHGIYRVKDSYFRDAVVLCNPVAKYFAEHNKTSVWDVMNTFEDWTTVIRYAKFDPELIKDGWKNCHPVTRGNIRDYLGMEPVGDILYRKNLKNLGSAEYEWWHWVERDRKDEWKGDWYTFDSVYLLRLYGQLLTALAH